MHAVAMIGAGRIGRIHAANIAAHPRLRLACVADVATDAADALAARHGTRATDVVTALTDPAIDAVVIASPTALHCDHMLATAEANPGRAIFCEKPIDLDLGRASAVVERLDRIGARVLIGFNRRFDPHFAALGARLTVGAIGPVEAIHIVSHDPAPPPVDYLASSGGLFRDMVIHDFDMARWLLGAEPVGVFASAACLIDPAIAAVGDVDTARTILRTADGRLCTISSSRRSGYGYDQRIEAYGAGGMIRVGNVTETTLETWGPRGGSTDPLQNFFLDRYAQAYVNEIAHFADVIDGAAPQVTLHDGIAALALAEAAARSALSGRMETP
ncbi:inositol 2-dehydrogenase [Sphingomonas sp. HMWF008]|nr:inositol 2-dehydrogenase [Sphingomonas sp. HMWF008]